MKTVIIDFELGMAWEVEVPNAYRFDYDATQEALTLMHDLRLKCAGDAGIGWQILWNAAKPLEKECAKYFGCGK